MGSEGYLINEFIVRATNHRTDEWGGDYANRMRFPIEIVRRIREAVGEDFIIIYRLSMLDLVPGARRCPRCCSSPARSGRPAPRSSTPASAGTRPASRPSRCPSPRGAYTWVTKQIMGTVGIPVVTSNRINNPELADELIADGVADMVSLARPMLADPDFVAKAAAGDRTASTPIACNQACLDHTFALKITSCLVSPRACHETELVLEPAAQANASPWWAQGGGTGLRDRGGRARARRDPLRGRRRHRRPAAAGQRKYRASRSSTRPCATTACAWPRPAWTSG